MFNCSTIDLPLTTPQSPPKIGGEPGVPDYRKFFIITSKTPSVFSKMSLLFFPSLEGRGKGEGVKYYSV